MEVPTNLLEFGQGDGFFTPDTSIDAVGAESEKVAEFVGE
jgi:hypothetical protein